METLDLCPFQWPRPPASGFRWVPSAAADISRGPWLVADQLELMRAERYDPTRLYPGLFRTFAALLEATEEPSMAKTRAKVLGFANTYGCLGITEPLPSESAKDVSADTHAESIWLWYQAVVELKAILAVSDALKEGTIAALAPYVTVYVRTQPEARGEFKAQQVCSLQDATALTAKLQSPRTEWFCSVQTKNSFSANASYYPRDVHEGLPQAMRKAAWQFVTTEINWKLASSPDELPYAEVRLTFRPEEDDRPRFRFCAKHFLGALWMQLARYVDGDKDYVQCAQCDKWLEISLDATGFRTSRLYCSDACRSKAYRARQGQAHRLAHEGKTLAEIAHALETSAETVQGWLDKPPPGNGTGRRGRKPQHTTAQGKS